MSDNIIDFGKRRREHMQNQPVSEVSMEALLKGLTSVPQNDLMASVGQAVQEKMTRLLIMTDIASKASEMLGTYGFDPNDFYLEPESLNRYLSGEMDEGEDALWNGPFFDWDAEDENQTTVRVLSTIRNVDVNANDTAVQLALEMFKLGKDDEVWSRFVDGEWLQDGPPADIFDTLGYEDFTDWDEVEDDDDDAPDGEPRGDDDWDWDDDDMNSIYMYDFSPAAMKALTLAGIETVDALKAMSDAQLAAIPGLSEKDVRRIKKVLSFDR